MIESVLSYGPEVWSLKAAAKRRINAAEMHYLRRRAGISRLRRISNQKVSMDVREETTVACIENCRLQWFGHVKTMEYE